MELIEPTFTGTFGFLFYQYDLQTQQPGSTPMGFDTEFSLKHANNPDTLVIDHFYFKDGYPNQLEAEVTDNGFRIADLQIMGVMQVETNVGMVNAIFTFAGLPESETDNFEYVKQTLMQGVVDYILKPTLTPHELLGVLQKAAARIPGWHPDHAMTGETAEELLKELLLGETKTGEELQKVFAASYYCMYAVTIAHGSERAAETAELLCEKIQRAKNEFSGVLICSLPTGILFLVLQKSFANGIVGAVKG